jgi:hypothetical protein
LKEDVLEQIVDDYLQMNGYFTTHNVRFKPSRDHARYETSSDSVASDVDVVGYHPNRRGRNRVVVVSCKAWQTGFAADRMLAQLRGTAPNPRRARWKNFRELWDPKWAEAFVQEVEARTGSARFTYFLAVTHVRGDASAWENDPTIRKNLCGNPFRFLTLETMWSSVLTMLTTTPAASEIGRLAQLLKAAGLTAPFPVLPPTDPPAREARAQRSKPATAGPIKIAAEPVALEANGASMAWSNLIKQLTTRVRSAHEPRQEVRARLPRWPPDRRSPASRRRNGANLAERAERGLRPLHGHT